MGIGKFLFDKACEHLLPDEIAGYKTSDLQKAGDVILDVAPPLAQLDPTDSIVLAEKLLNTPDNHREFASRLPFLWSHSNLETLLDLDLRARKGGVAGAPVGSNQNLAERLLLDLSPAAFFNTEFIPLVTRTIRSTRMGRGIENFFAERHREAAEYREKKARGELKGEEVSEEELNNKVADNFQNKKIENIKITFREGGIVLKGTYKAMFDLDFCIKITLSVTDGQARGRIKIEASGLDLTGFLKNTIYDELRKNGIEVPPQASLDDLRWLKLPNIKSLDFAPGRAVVEKG